MTGETVPSNAAEQALNNNSDMIRRCAAAGRICLPLCMGPEIQPINHGDQGGGEAGGLDQICPSGQEPDLHMGIYQ